MCLLGVSLLANGASCAAASRHLNKELPENKPDNASVCHETGNVYFIFDHPLD